MESTESRFAHLLQPIRELTKNWEIDVASELNDYLEELDNMCITYDGGKTRLNFAEAALLIQGSTCIYSKKVEMLHSLVYQTLEYINDRNKKRNKQTAASQEDDADGEASDHDGDAMFISLDIEASQHSKKNESKAFVSVAPLPPESLIPPETSEKHKLPLIRSVCEGTSVAGDVLCSQKDFRINLFIPGDQDLILLTLGSAAARFLLDGGPQPADSLPQDQDQNQIQGLEAPADAEDNGGDAAENFLPLEDNNMELDQDPEEHVERHQAPREDRMIRERRLVLADRLKETEETPPAVTAWTLHNPHAVSEGDKPLKPGKFYKVPAGLDDGGKRKRKQGSCLQDFRSWFRGTFDPPEQKLKNGPTLTELNYIYLSTMKNKLRTQKRINRRAGVLVSDEELKRTFLQPEEAGPQQQQEEEPMDGFRAPDLLGGDDDASDNELPADFGGDAPRDELSYEDLVKLRVEQLVANCRGYTQETALSRRVKDWEDKIRPELALQEQRPVFDIHDYGGRIIRELNAVGRRRSLASIVSGLDQFEACKYLLAALQLANDYTVEVDSVSGLEDSVDSVGLTLLSTHRATDRFKNMTST